MKPGIKSTEFYLYLLAAIVSGLTASGVFDCAAGATCPDWQNTALRILGAIGVILSAFGYGVPRNNLKIANAEAVTAIASANPTQPPKP